MTISISKYSNAYSRTPLTVNLYEEIMRIKDGYYEHLVQNCRNALLINDIEGYKKAKSGLPAVTFSGVFNGAHKRENITAYNKMVVIDIDNLNKNLLEEKLLKLKTDKYILCCWKSPSNRGIKLLIKANSTLENHKYAFDAISQYLELNYDLNVDKSGSDVCRLCYISFDQDLFINPLSETFEFTNPEELKGLKKNGKKISKEISDLNVQLGEVAFFHQTEGRNSKHDRETISLIVKFLKKNKASITGDYSSWLKVAFAISNAFTYDLGRKYFLSLCELDGLNHDEYKSINLLEYCYRNRRLNVVGFGTIVHLAKERGFILKGKTPSS